MVSVHQVRSFHIVYASHFTPCIGDKLKEHLVGLISRKLDDKVLEIMCTYHARNRTLKLVLEDVSFLQPAGATPTYTLYFPIPKLLHDYAQPLAFYFLQNMSTFCMKPKYASEKSQNYFQVCHKLCDP